MTTPHRARKRFGQNFLHDQGVIRRIVAGIHPSASQHLVEIGPGQGAITESLLDSDCRLDVIELDRNLIPVLEQKFAGRDNFHMHEADAMQFDYEQLVVGEKKLRMVGNLPYNISTPLIFHLLDSARYIEDMHFMLQREVVNRMAASPGSKAWGKLGVMTQLHCEVESLFEVPPGAFSPAPKVVSAIVRLTPRPTQPDPDQVQRLRKVVSAAFSQRRKTLRNTLRDLVDVQQLKQLGIDPGARAETLSLEQFIAISDTIGRDQQ